jgi:hypothetical protein
MPFSLAEVRHGVLPAILYLLLGALSTVAAGCETQSS